MNQEEIENFVYQISGDSHLDISLEYGAIPVSLRKNANLLIQIMKEFMKENEDFVLIGDFDNILASADADKIIDFIIENNVTMYTEDSYGEYVSDKDITIRNICDKNVLKLKKLIDNGYKICRVSPSDRSAYADITFAYKKLIELYEKPQGEMPRRFCDLKIISADGAETLCNMNVIFGTPSMKGGMEGDTDGDIIEKFGLTYKNRYYTWRLPEIFAEISGEQVQFVVDRIYDKIPVSAKIREEHSDEFAANVKKFAAYFGIEL